MAYFWFFWRFPFVFLVVLTDLSHLNETIFKLIRAHSFLTLESYRHVSQKPEIVLSSTVFTSDFRSERFLAMLLQFRQKFKNFFFIVFYFFEMRLKFIQDLDRHHLIEEVLTSRV